MNVKKCVLKNVPLAQIENASLNVLIQNARCPVMLYANYVRSLVRTNVNTQHVHVYAHNHATSPSVMNLAKKF